MNTQKFKDFVLDCWFDGMTAQQIASSPTAKTLYSHGSSRDLTKNAIIGIVNRNGGTFKQGMKSETYQNEVKGKISFIEIARQIEQEQLKIKMKKEKGKYRERKCLTCQEKSIMEKNMFICKTCKENNTKYGSVESYEVHI
jgi:hypothetical protein